MVSNFSDIILCADYYRKEIIIQRFLEASRGWVPDVCNNLDDTGAAGDTFEALFGLKQNNSPSADFHHFEFKSQYITQKSDSKGQCANTNTKGYIHLFKFVPTMKFQPGTVIDKYTKRFYFVDGQNGYLYSELKNKFKGKLTYLVFVKCETKKEIQEGNVQRLFHYDTMRIYSCADFKTFCELLRNKTIKIEDDEFLITENRLERLYRKVETIFGTTLPPEDYISFYPAANISLLGIFDGFRFIRTGARSDLEAKNNKYDDYASYEKIDESALPKGDFPQLSSLGFQPFSDK